MRVVLFDLGDTLEHDDVLLPGAREMLEAVRGLRDDGGEPPVLGLVSDFLEPQTPAEIPAIQQEYYKILVDLGIRDLFEPVAGRVTLSTEVGVRKPDERIFRTALDRVQAGLPFHHAVFITERPDHVAAARALGMMAIHFQGPGQQTGDVGQLSGLPPLIQRLIAFGPCCKKHEEAVGRTPSFANRSKQADPGIAAVVAKVDPDRLSDRLTRLVEFRTRWSLQQGIARVPEWIHDQLTGMGYADGTMVRYQDFQFPGSGPQRNVLCGPADPQRGFILVGAHYDSLSEQPAVLAPGADDNASGVAAVLELARLLKDHPLKRGLVFAFFGGEEQGLFGSQACAETAAQEGWPIDLMINLDMVGHRDAARPPRIVVEYDQGNRNPGNDAAAKAYGLLMAQAAADYTSLEVEHTDIWNSDYMPFEAKGYACIGAFEGGENPFYHRSTDALATVDIPYLTDVLRMVLATVLIVGG